MVEVNGEGMQSVERPAPPGMRLIGLLGGVASGKSLVAQALAAKGAWVLDADRAAHEVLRTAEVRDAAAARWGREILGEDGQIVRGRLARIVFAPTAAGAAELEYLEQLVHPATGRRLRQEAERGYAAGFRLAVLDAPLLLEASWGKFCDRLVFVDASRQLRLERACRRGWSETEFAARERAQESLHSKRKLAAVVIDNSGSPEQTRAEVERVWPILAG